ncbi:nucleotide sugar dehydrogenase [Metabacillus halosaccharovorans]|uniref:nucleotide sugar dehydrogenase n=1 Tax=Metabacillus halosaccharovorans TaxID=930124 RepID=UPI001FEBD63F|nr:nucleotide sugar dehydrogenase [Metabacillus halosaccharovorans]
MIAENQLLHNIAVVGLGKIGLTLAAVFANNSCKVLGADIDPKVVSSVNNGISHVKNEPGLEELVANAHHNKTLTATTITSEAVAQSDIVIVIVPVLIDDKNHVDYRYIDSAVEEIGKGVKKSTLVIFETTLPPGDTRNRFGKKIEEVSGLRMGTDFDLAYSPERVYSNRIIEDLQNYPKIIGGLTEKSLKRASAFYQKTLNCEIIEVSSLETAEFAKVAECVYRDVNIALANDLAKFADNMNVNILEVIDSSNSQPYSHIHQPGIGVGGHCIPIYPYFFINKGLVQGLTPLSRKINDRMSDYAISKIEKEMGSLQKKNILILGLSYRENVKETTKSTSLAIIEILKEKDVQVFVADPLFENEEIIKYDVIPFDINDQTVSSEIDIIILQAYHDEFKKIDFESFTKCTFVYDGRNKLSKEKIEELGMRYSGIGK